MLAYILRRLLLIIPTLFGIMVVNFAIVQVAPGGPIDQVIAQIRGAGGGGEGREDEDRGGMDLREAGEEEGREQTGQDKQDAA